MVAKTWCEKQDQLEASLRKSYNGADLSHLSPPGSDEQRKPVKQGLDLAESDTSGQLTQVALHPKHQTLNT